MPSLVFLDFDGVLNSQWGGGFNDRLDPRLVQKLNRFHGDVEFVISSAWRSLHPLCELIDMLREAGFEGKVAGCTPLLHGELRGHEIAEYLRTWPGGHHRLIWGVAILDDLPGDEFDPLQYRHVQTSSRHGLSDDDVQAARELLMDPFERNLEL